MCACVCLRGCEKLRETASQPSTNQTPNSPQTPPHTETKLGSAGAPSFPDPPLLERKARCLPYSNPPSASTLFGNGERMARGEESRGGKGRLAAGVQGSWQLGRMHSRSPPNPTHPRCSSPSTPSATEGLSQRTCGAEKRVGGRGCSGIVWGPHAAQRVRRSGGGGPSRGPHCEALALAGQPGDALPLQPDGAAADVDEQVQAAALVQGRQPLEVGGEVRQVR
jgi:hypothetical protein